MLRHLILKRLRLNLMSLRFLYGLALMVGLLALSGVVLTQSFKSRMQYARARDLEWRSSLEAAPTYNQTYGQVILEPSVLSIVAEGIGDRFGMIARAFGQFGGLRIGGRAQSNRLLTLLPMDLSHVVGLILSLIAILLTYDAISGDRESGTLRLTLSYSLARPILFLGEALAALMTVLLALAPAALLWLLVVRMSGLPGFSSDDWYRLGTFFIATVLFLFIYVNIGLFFSATLRESTTSLMWGLLIWVVTTSLYPSLAAWSATQIKPSEPNHGFAERTNMNQMIAQARLARHLQLLSPVQTFYALAARIADTDLEAYVRFVNYAQRYQERVAEWHRQKLAHHPERESRWSSGFGLLDTGDFPQPVLKTDAFAHSVVSSSPYFSLLIIFNGTLMFATLLALNRYDPR